MVGPRVFTLEEANALVPTFEEAFTAIDAERERLKAAKVKLNALEMIWGAELHAADCPDRAEAQALVQELKDLEEAVKGTIRELAAEGALVKDVGLGLVDVYHVHEGRLVFLCWQRGESTIEAWHDVDTGFADRRPLD